MSTTGTTRIITGCDGLSCYRWWDDPKDPLPIPPFPELTTIKGISLKITPSNPPVLIPLNNTINTTSTTLTTSTTIKFSTSTTQIPEIIECEEYCKKLGF